MIAQFKTLGAAVRRVWIPPAGPWGPDVVAIMKLLKAIESAPEPVDVGALLDQEIAAADRMRNGEVSDHPQTKFDGQQLGEALRRVRAALR